MAVTLDQARRQGLPGEVKHFRFRPFPLHGLCLAAHKGDPVAVYNDGFGKWGGFIHRINRAVEKDEVCDRAGRAAMRQQQKNQEQRDKAHHA